MLSGSVLLTRNVPVKRVSEHVQTIKHQDYAKISQAERLKIPRHPKHETFLNLVRRRFLREDEDLPWKYTLVKLKDGTKSRPKERRLLSDCGVQDFDAPVMRKAAMRLFSYDVSLQRAATSVQRAWRRSQTRCSQKCSASPKEYINKMATKTVVAPAYLGESCMWLPLDEWGQTPTRYLYTAVCETLGETVFVPRSAIQDMLERFSPWLPDRFEFFRKNVAVDLAAIARGTTDELICSQQLAQPAITEMMAPTHPRKEEEETFPL